MIPSSTRRERRFLSVSGVFERLSLVRALSICWTVVLLNLWRGPVASGSAPTSGLIWYSLFTLTLLTGFYICTERGATRRYGIPRFRGIGKKLSPMPWLLALSVYLLDTSATPANAQSTGANNSGFFFTNIQTKISGIFTGTNQQAIVPIIRFGFGVLQVLFIMYIAWAVAKVISAAQQEEDWKQAAKTPLIVAAAVFGGDFAVGLV